MPDVVIVGGGVVGLTAAYELSKSGATVTVLDQAEMGTEASWAGAGMLPPAQLYGSNEVKELQRESHTLWPELSKELLALTGMDNGYRNCGSIQIQLNKDQHLAEDIAGYQQQTVPVQPLNKESLNRLESALSSKITSGYKLPTMCQVRNPWHLKALVAACLKQGVTLHPGQAVHDWRISDNSIQSAMTSSNSFSADQFLITAGAWASQLLTSFKIDFHVQPVRGQIVLLKVPQLPFTHIVECGPRYLVPRNDGRILIGSTEEQTGFRKANTPAGVEDLLKFATAVVPTLQNATIERTWSGLRPYSKTGPFIGQIPEMTNLYVATGHFRDGLSQSPATGLLISNVMLKS